MTTEPLTEVTPSANHHSSHRHLLTNEAGAAPAPIDAIIVPTARPVAYLRTAIALAKQQGCPLVALCSRRASAEAAVKLAQPMNIEIIAVDVAELPRELLPRFSTSEVLRSTRFNRHADTSLKRNLGLLLAQAAGWERIVFLDDDISVPRAGDLNDAAGLVGRYAVAGLSIGGYPDNSVVCHAFRDAGGRQDTFIGGGALVVGRQSFTSFFPNIYNEDWFFLLDDTKLRPSAVTGLAIQAPYDPYRETTRARSEELGDCLAEGLFRLLDTGQRLTDATPAYWAGFLRQRRRFIDEVIALTAAQADLSAADRVRMTAALKAARGRNLLIEPALCMDYMRAWRADRKQWRLHVHRAARVCGPGGKEKLLADLGLMHVYRAAA
ncbi:MAG: hypothetical protein ABW224_24105 [Kibdelosporangium sp.]